MTEFAPAVRANTAIVLALAGASGSGKTKSALELAVGLAGERGQIALIDTEGSRALHYAPTAGSPLNYADEYRFLHAPWDPPFNPEALGQMLREAERRKYAVVIVDSMSDEHEGEGGLCDMAEEEYQRQQGNKNSAAAWAKPKAAHKLHIVRWLRQARCHIIFCLRADEKVEFQTVNGKTKIVPLGWTPIAEKRLLYDVTTSLLFTPDEPGIPKPIKLYDKHKPFFPADRQVTREAGKRLAEWAAGGPSRPGTPTPAQAPLGEPDPLEEMADRIAKLGTHKFREWWVTLTREHQGKLRPFVARYQGIAQEADEQNARTTSRDGAVYEGMEAGARPSATAAPASGGSAGERADEQNTQGDDSQRVEREGSARDRPLPGERPPARGSAGERTATESDDVVGGRSPSPQNTLVP